jgi:hypothetical protein
MQPVDYLPEVFAGCVEYTRSLRKKVGNYIPDILSLCAFVNSCSVLTVLRCLEYYYTFCFYTWPNRQNEFGTIRFACCSPPVCKPTATSKRCISVWFFRRTRKMERGYHACCLAVGSTHIISHCASPSVAVASFYLKAPSYPRQAAIGLDPYIDEQGSIIL